MTSKWAPRGAYRRALIGTVVAAGSLAMAATPVAAFASAPHVAKVHAVADGGPYIFYHS